MVSMFESAETIVERVAALEQMLEIFQSEPDDAKAQWNRIEKMIFGVDFPE
jgi:hypothetical protein